MEQDAQYAVLAESIAEMSARLRILDEAYARLEAAAERQLELIEILVSRHEQVLALLMSRLSECKLHDAPPIAPGTGSGVDGSSQLADRIIDRNTEYARATHPALFKVIDLLEQNEDARTLSVRQLAQQTGVSKSWCAIAKRYMLREEAVH